MPPSHLHKKLLDLVEVISGKCPAQCCCAECPYRKYENCSTHAKVDYLLKHGIGYIKWISVYKRLPTEADADEHGYVLAQSHQGMIRTVRWSMVVRDLYFYEYWMPTPKPHATD